MKDYSQYTTEQLLEAIPQNRPLYKDSDTWDIRDEDMKGIFMTQHPNETLKAFLIRYIEWLCTMAAKWEISIDNKLDDMVANEKLLSELYPNRTNF